MIRSLQVCRALAALSIVLHHTSACIFSLPKYFEERPFGGVFEIGHAGLDFFFVLSGFLVMYVHGRDVGRPGRLPGFLAKRFLRLYPAYWVVLLAVAPVFFLRPDFGTGRERDLDTLVSCFLLLPQEDPVSVLIVAWTLVFEVFFYLMFGAVILGRRTGVLAFALWAGCILLGQSVSAFPFTFFAHPLFIKYMVGMLVALAVKRWAVPLPRTVALLGVAAMLVTNHMQLREGFGYTTTLSWGYTLGSALVLLGVVQADRAGGLPAPAPLTWLGDASYSIYLVHFPALSVLAKLAKTASLDAYVPEAVLFFALAAGAVGCACLFHLLVERPLHALTRLHWRRTPVPTPGIATSGHDRYKPAA